MKQYGKEILLCVLLGVVIPYFAFVLLRGEPNKNHNDAKAESLASPPVEEEKDQTVRVLDKESTVQTISLDDYLTAVLLQEMPADFHEEALKAQAVVARTYVLRRTDNDKHSGADVCMDPNCCQGYCNIDEYLERGGKASSVNKVTNAVKQTQDLVLVYNGALIDATYFSCSGGMTESAVAVWGADIPYLQATKSPGEEGATHYADTVTFPVAEFAEKLQADLQGNPESWIEEITYTSGGGVDRIRICGVDYKGTEIRKLLGLRSTSFAITAIGSTVTITTRGYGHRVGMSQYGAEAMAVQGKQFEEILHHYYKDTQLVSMESLKD